MKKYSAASSPCHCIKLRQAASAITDYYNRCLAPCGLTVNQFALLRNLQHLEESSVSRLAQQMGLERSTLVRNLKPLLEAGHVEDKALPGNRDRQLRLSPAGLGLLEKSVPLWRQAQQNTEQVLHKSQLEKLLRQLAELPAAG